MSVFVAASWSYAAFLIPLVAVAAGSGAVERTVLVDRHNRGAARPGRCGLRNLQQGLECRSRRHGRDAAALYAAPAADSPDPAADTLAAGLSRASLALAIVSGAGIALTRLAARHRPPRPRAVDYAAAAATSAHTLPAHSATNRLTK